ncbi:MAG TPA: phosphodiester glycosidase family protein [Thermotogota bacterium]|nr:phosphodiester glycosidase family protein [Thermotogota bacterium]HRW92408.1 phosphodiester glycosidase family protein [Thermotogota bacterium]
MNRLQRGVFLFFAFVLFVPACFGQELFLIKQDGDFQRFREPQVLEMSGKLLLDVESLLYFGAGVTRFGDSQKYYIVNTRSRDTLIADPMKGFTLNFLEKVDGMVILNNKKTYVSADTVMDFLGYTFLEGERYYAFLPGELIKLYRVEMVERTLRLTFSSPFLNEEELLKVHTKGNEVEVSLFPVDLEEAVIRDVMLETRDRFYSLLKLSFNVPVDYTMSRSGNEVSVYFRHVDPYLEEIEVLTSGVQWYRKKEVLDGATLRVSYLEIDLQKASVSVEPEMAVGTFGSRETPSAMVRRTMSYGGVNGSYFDTATGFPVGLLVKEGRVLSEPYYYKRPIFAKTQDGKYVILNVDSEIHLSLGSLLYLVKGVNKFSQNGDIIIYTEEFGSQIPNRPDREYVVVSGGKVLSKGYAMRAPKDGFVVMMGPVGVANFVKVGDSAEYRLVIPGYPYGLEYAVEGGPQIIEGGKLIPSLETEKVRYGQRILTAKTPRTVVAIAPGRLVFMVIDGYQSQSAGLTFEELADFLIKKGFTDAMCFDGGSSSTMVAGGKVVNNPSGGEPQIPVGVLIKRVFK